ncbi:PREDICTED: odorant receptor 22c-like isoform X2 [Vollenhovia emeryi]|uniref:odorant receptor 22c-like isoform X2 n=1 Tax=Vollenhovia emeryi TaxID=411798 RepID=UPI0005F36668|nr:PREDICTED: odorant receptor 22c-like isoform X2 [Vollenhovia emeryi]
MKRATTISFPVEIGLRLTGMWPDSAYPNVYWSMYMTMIVILQYYQYSYIVAHFSMSNLTTLAECLGLTLTNTLALIKLFFLRWNRRIFHNILAAMDEDWNDCVVNDSCSTMTSIAAKTRRYSIGFIGINNLAAFFLTVVAYMVHTMNNADSEASRELPVKMEFPVAVLKSPLFECILGIQIFYELSTSAIAGMVNALLATLILHVSGQIDIMRQAITKVYSDEFGTSLTVIDDVIRRHRKIITLSNDIETLFSAIALIQLLWNTLTICFTGFMMILALSSKKGIIILAKPFFLYFAKTVEVFVFCYAGEFLSSKSKSINDAVYESVWYNMEPSDSRILLFIMMRSQKRLTITAGKTFDLTLEGFMSHMHGHTVSMNGQLFREFPIQIQFPFDVYKTPVYELISVGLFFHVLEMGIVMAMVNALILTLSLNSKASNSGIVIRFVIPYLVATIEAFVLCFAGDYLSTKSKAIGDAAYEVVWYDLSTSECRILLFVILRSQKQLTITAGKIVHLTLESFITVMKASASYVSVLFALY